MPIYTEDQRSPVSYHTVWIHDGERRNDRDTTIQKGSGTVRRFSGTNEGKFIPGIYRVNPMQASRTTYVYGTAMAQAQTKDGRDIYQCSGSFGAQTGFRVTSIKYNTYDNSLMDSAVQKAHASLISADLDLGEFLAELPETISMVKGGVVLLQRAIKNASRSGFTWEKANRARLALISGKTIKSLPKRVANSWLTWRYGIRPLIWDVQGLIKEANDFALQSNFSGLRRKRGRVSHSESYAFQYRLNAYYSSLQYIAKEFVEKTVNGEAAVYYSYGAGFGPVNYILQKYGLHPNQFPYLLWQLVPLSFMVDWFVDVGTWVKAITPKWNMHIHGCSASQKTRFMSSRIATSANSDYRLEYSSSTLLDKCIIESIDRRERTLSGAVPRLKPKIILSIQQQADLLSVLLQRALSNRRH